MLKDRFFYDTCSLLIAGERVFQSEVPFIVSSITFKELERIKTSMNKDNEIKHMARILLRMFELYPNKYNVIIHKQEYEKWITDMSLEVNDDTKILSDAIRANEHDDIIFITNDLSLKHIANLFFGDAMIDSVTENNEDNYIGYKEVIADDESLIEFYQEPYINHFDLLINEYLILKDKENKIIDTRVWTGNDHRYLTADSFTSKWFGKTRARDVYQKCVIDSFRNNKLTYVGGPAGSGKSSLSLSFLFSELAHGAIDQIILFCNPVVARNAAKLG